jgi:hypothetical protein
MKFKFLPLMLLIVGFASAAQKNSAESSSPRGRCSRTEAARLFKRFSRILLPANAANVSRTLASSDWISRAEIYHLTFMTGWIPLKHNLSPPGGVFVINLVPPTSQRDAGYSIYVHTTADSAIRESLGKTDAAAISLRHFLAGDAPSNVKIDEYALCYPDGRILHVLPDSRKMMPSMW